MRRSGVAFLFVKATAAIASSGLVVALLMSSCSSAASDGASTESQTRAVSSSEGESTTVLVALGDSDTNGHGDPSGTGWVGYYAALVHAATGRKVAVHNLAVDGLTSDDLRLQLLKDQALRAGIASADFIVLGLGGGDLNTADSSYLAKTCAPAACYGSAISHYGQNMDTIAAEIAEIRGQKPTVLRAVSGPNIVPGAEDVIPAELLEAARRFGLSQARGLRDQTCRAMTLHNGRCIDVVTAVNGPDGTADGYAAGLLNHSECCYPNAAGQRLMAKLLIQTGTKPIQLH